MAGEDLSQVADDNNGSETTKTSEDGQNVNVVEEIVATEKKREDHSDGVGNFCIFKARLQEKPKQRRRGSNREKSSSSRKDSPQTHPSWVVDVDEHVAWHSRFRYHSVFNRFGKPVYLRKFESLLSKQLSI